MSRLEGIVSALLKIQACHEIEKGLSDSTTLRGEFYKHIYIYTCIINIYAFIAKFLVRPRVKRRVMYVTWTMAKGSEFRGKLKRARG